MNQDKLTQLIQLKIMEKLGARVAETPEMKALTEEISGLFTKQNSILVDEIGQLQQAYVELSKIQEYTTEAIRRLVKRIDMQENKIHSMSDVIDELVEMVEPEECDCIHCKVARRQAIKKEENTSAFEKLPIQFIRVLK